MALIDAGLRGALIALLLLLAALLPKWRHPRDATLVRIGVALLLSLAVQAFSASPWAEYELSCAAQSPGIGLSLAISVLFWLFAQAIFDDEFRLRPWHGLLWAGVAVFGGTVCWWRGMLGAPGMALMRALPVVFSVLAMTAVIRPWRADLVEQRRRWRAIVVAGGALYAVAMVSLRLGSEDGRLGSNAALADVLMMLALVAWGGRQLLTPKPGGSWMGTAQPEPAAGATAGARAVACAGAFASIADRVDVREAARPLAQAEPDAQSEDPQDEADEGLAEALARHMQEQRGYAREGLTVGGLAQTLGAPEYRLRRVINQRLGHRNFNVFVNSLRLAEAQRRLADPAERQLPVLSIALDVGFASIGPFNRAFKAQTGMTPTEFRQQALADS